jgi:hypothetical protein
MATQPESLFGAEVPQAPLLRAFPAHDGIRPGKLGSTVAAVDLANLTPLFFDVSESEWAVWIGQTNEVTTLTADGTPASAGDFTLTFEGEETDPIVFDATAAIVQAALEALPNVEVGDVVAVGSVAADLGDAGAVITLTWGGQYAGQDIVITADQTGISAGNDFVLAEATAGGDDPSEGHLIDGFLWTPEAPHTTTTAGEQIVQVFLAGSIHAADVAVPAGESRADLNEALLVSSLREKGIHILGLAGIH